ncbi:MAG: transglutaminase family protein [Candidatus Dormibacteria bacterium]
MGCEFEFDSVEAAPSVFQVQPHPGAEIGMGHESWMIEPDQARTEYVDSFANRCQRFTLPTGLSRIRYEAQVVTPGLVDRQENAAAQTAFDALPPECLPFTLPSRYCLSDVLAGSATGLFAAIEPGWGQVQAVCDWVHENVAYTIGASTHLTDAVDVYISRQGVCRDFAHLAITFCRALSYPARYAFGYLPLLGSPLPEEGMDFAAWMEVFVGGDWFTFDPRNNSRRAGRVLVGRGRDALDVAMVTSWGAPRLASMTVWADA